MIFPPNYSAAILCGGLSRRMGGDKAFLRDSAGQLLLATLARTLSAWFEETRLITDRPAKLTPWPELNYPIEGDRYPRSGPVGAILTALQARPGQTFFALAGDQPSLDLELLQRLRERLERRQADLALPRLPTGIEPLHAFYGPGCAPVFAASLAQGRRAIRESFPALKVAYLDLSPEDLPPGMFKNLNTPQEAQEMGYSLDAKLPQVCEVKTRL
ncbi:MAG: molybdenum cofactor guanylyltransferase [Deltaproteobacteria bacterium]|jgi:molybdopterin-guanine dinucleotide biosynthesis protein A|nr:molybdenum cofactor guanylyltransferase [Deltaproteobacteria bacterium]